MQRHELDIRDRLQARDLTSGRVITTNSIRTFFTPLADQLLKSECGVLAKVIPATACTGASGVDERRFLADRFHIERIVTTHDPEADQLLGEHQYPRVPACLSAAHRRATADGVRIASRYAGEHRRGDQGRRGNRFGPARRVGHCLPLACRPRTLRGLDSCPVGMTVRSRKWHGILRATRCWNLPG